MATNSFAVEITFKRLGVFYVPTLNVPYKNFEVDSNENTDYWENINSPFIWNDIAYYLLCNL